MKAGSTPHHEPLTRYTHPDPPPSPLTATDVPDSKRPLRVPLHAFRGHDLARVHYNNLASHPPSFGGGPLPIL